MDQYINENSDIFDEPPKKKGFTIGKLFKWIMAFLIIAVYGILFARCYMSGDHEIVDKVLINEEFISAYNDNKEEFVVKEYGFNKSWAPIREGRLLEFSNLYYIPLANQLQLSVKFNTDLPQFDYEMTVPFEFVLTDEDATQYKKYFYEYAERYSYGYVRLCFEGVTLEIPDEYDDYGNQKMRSLNLKVSMINKDGGYDEISSTRIYAGAVASRNVKFTINQ